MSDGYESGSLSLTSAVSMGTGVMIGAGIFALTGQVAELAGPMFPVAFVAAGIVSAFSAYTYIKMSNAYPSAGGIAMYLKQAYGRGLVTGGCALLMVFSMIINESLVARTFGTYVLQAFDVEKGGAWVPALGVALLAVALLINLADNIWISRVSFVSAFLKVGGIVVFALVTLWSSGFSFEPSPNETETGGIGGMVAATALAILAYKGFTTITNDGDEIEDPTKNVGRAIVISLSICLGVYVLVTLAVGSQLSISQIVEAKNYALAEAARPVVGCYGVWFTVGVAIIATASGIMASVFAVSRMLAMLTKMELIPHRHLGMPGAIQTHTLVYTVGIAMVLTVAFDLTRIASLGAIYYLVMDIFVHFGVYRHLRTEIEAQTSILIAAIAFDAIALVAFVWVKAGQDATIVAFGAVSIVAIFAAEKWFLRVHEYSDGSDPNYVSPSKPKGG